MSEVCESILKNLERLREYGKCNEENTKNCLIIPFLENFFAIDFSNPKQVLSQKIMKRTILEDVIIL